MIRLLIFVCFIIPNILFAQGINDGLLLYYPFNGDALDHYGNDFHGSVYATPSKDPFGNPNSAFHFNGIDEFIEIPHSSKYKLPLPLSFSFWVKFENLDRTKSVVFTTDFHHEIYSGVFFSLTGDQNFFAIAYGDLGRTTTSSRRTRASNKAITRNLWHHIVAVIKGPNDIELYLDCENVGGEYSGTGGPLQYTNGPATLGKVDASNHYPEFYFQGSLDEFRYYNRALTPAEIDTLCGYVTTNTNQLKENDLRIQSLPQPCIKCY